MFATIINYYLMTPTPEWARQRVAKTHRTLRLIVSGKVRDRVDF